MWQNLQHPSIINSYNFSPSSNQIVRCPSIAEDKTLTLIIPTHFSFNVHNINQIDIDNATAEVNATLILAVFYKDFNLPGQRTEQLAKLLSQKIQVQLSHESNINLTKRNKNVEFIQHKDKGAFVFKVREDFGAIFVQDVRLTPIQKLSIIFSIKINDLSEQFDNLFTNIEQQLALKNESKVQDKYKVKIKFNLMQFKKNRQLSKNDQFQNKKSLAKRKINEGGQVYFEDELNIGEYQILTKQTASQTSIYRVPYKIARAMDLQIANNKTEIQYANITKKQVKPEKLTKKNSKISSIKSEQQDKLLPKPQQDEDKIYYYQRANQLQSMSQSSRQNQNQNQNQSHNQNQNQGSGYKMRSFNTTYLTITLFRHPTVGILTILFPLLTIAFLNWSIFGIPTGQEGQDIKRLTVIITTIAAFISLVSVVRERIPATDKLTYIQIIVFSQLIPSVCAVIELMRYKDQPAPSWTIEHIIGIFFTLIVVFACVFYFVYFYKFLYNQFRSQFKMVNPADKKYLLDRNQWQNKRCEYYFEDLRRQIYKVSQHGNQMKKGSL